MSVMSGRSGRVHPSDVDSGDERAIRNRDVPRRHGADRAEEDDEPEEQEPLARRRPANAAPPRGGLPVAAPVAAPPPPAAAAAAAKDDSFLQHHWKAALMCVGVLLLLLLVLISVGVQLMRSDRELTASHVGNVFVRSACRVVGPKSIICTVAKICPLSEADCSESKLDQVPPKPSPDLVDAIKKQPPVPEQPANMRAVAELPAARTYESTLDRCLDTLNHAQFKDNDLHKAATQVGLQLRKFHSKGVDLQGQYTTSRVDMTGALLKITSAMESSRELFATIHEHLIEQLSKQADDSWLATLWKGRRPPNSAELSAQFQVSLERQSRKLDRMLGDADSLLSKAIQSLIASQDKTSDYAGSVSDVTDAVGDVVQAGKKAVDDVDGKKKNLISNAFGVMLNLLKGAPHNHNAEMNRLKEIFSPLVTDGHKLDGALRDHQKVMLEMVEYLAELRTYFTFTRSLLQEDFMPFVTNRYFINMVDLTFIQNEVNKIESSLKDIRKKITEAPVNKQTVNKLT
jgi:hypothetical protein